MSERPTARQLREKALAAEQGEPKQIAGHPADVCPYCGAAMFANGTRQGNEVTFRYVRCRNSACGKTFMSRQPRATLVREIKPKPDEDGPPILKVRSA